MKPMFATQNMKNYNCQLNFYNFDLTRYMIENRFAKKMNHLSKPFELYGRQRYSRVSSVKNDLLFFKIAILWAVRAQKWAKRNTENHFRWLIPFPQ